MCEDRGLSSARMERQPDRVSSAKRKRLAKLEKGAAKAPATGLRQGASAPLPSGEKDSNVPPANEPAYIPLPRHLLCASILKVACVC